jgi:hypothetical protein
LVFFFYGTLLDEEVLAAVIGRAVPPRCSEPAFLVGYRRVRMEGTRYPALVSGAGGRVDGLLVRGIAPTEAARLAAFEGPFYRLGGIRVTTARGRRVAASTFLPRGGQRQASGEWDPEAWRRHHKMDSLRGRS